MASGKYKSSDPIRPIHKRLSKFYSMGKCIVIQETERSYLIRIQTIRSNEKFIWSEAKWIRKLSIKLLEKVGEVNVNTGYVFRFFDMPGAEIKVEYKCKVCGWMNPLDKNSDTSQWKWLCKKCGKLYENGDFSIYNYIKYTKDIIVNGSSAVLTGLSSVAFKKKLENDELFKRSTKDICPFCKYKGNVMEDTVNRIIKCDKCGVYYIPK